jgi:molybdopterin-biosynthesis enzyme MoeA-like protein
LTALLLSACAGAQPVVTEPAEEPRVDITTTGESQVDQRLKAIEDRMSTIERQQAEMPAPTEIARPSGELDAAVRQAEDAARRAEDAARRAEEAADRAEEAAQKAEKAFEMSLQK